MRMIMDLQLDNGEVITVIGNAENKIQLKSFAVNNCHKLFADPKCHVTMNSEILHLERWSKERHLAVQNGYRLYNVSFIYNDLVQSLQIRSAGTKSAYNQIKINYGLEYDFFAMLYEVGQTNVKRKKSSLELSTSVVNEGCSTNNTSRIDNILSEAVKKLETSGGLGEYAADIPLLIGMIRSYFKGTYREVPVSTIIGVTAAVIYFISPVDVIPDVIPVLGQVDDIAVLTWTLKQAHNDIKRYEEFVNNENDVVIDA